MDESPKSSKNILKILLAEIIDLLYTYNKNYKGVLLIFREIRRFCKRKHYKGVLIFQEIHIFCKRKHASKICI